MKKRYKIRKEQLERVVENFVMEESMTMTKKHAPEAKKHKMSMGAEADLEDDMGEGMEMAKEKKDSKKKQAPEAKKHMTSMKESTYNYRDFLTEEEINEGVMESLDAFCEALGLMGNVSIGGDAVSKCLMAVLTAGSAGTVGAVMAKDFIKNGLKVVKQGGKAVSEALKNGYKAFMESFKKKDESIAYMNEEDIDATAAIKALFSYYKENKEKLEKKAEQV